MFGITSVGTYVPQGRLDRSAVAAVLGSSGGKGTRSVASYDEDTTSLGVEAGRLALRSGVAPSAVLFATTDPAYLDKTNATAVHAALGLDSSAAAFDAVGSVRSGIGALRSALDAAAAGRPTLAVLSDIRNGLPGGQDEVQGGDGAAAFLCGRDGVIAELAGAACSTSEFLDRWRSPGQPASRVWEERFGEAAYAPLAEAAVADACKQAGITIEAVDHLVLAGLHGRANRVIAKSLGVRKEALADDLTGVIGNTGCAHVGLLLADALDRAEPGQVVLVVSVADGVDALVFRTTEALPAARAGAVALRERIATETSTVAYPMFLTWRGMLNREPPRRPDPDRPAGPPSLRSEAWKFGFSGSRCIACGMRHLPPTRVCASCHAVDEMEPERLADLQATVRTFTVDRLAFSLNPPTVIVVVDFDGGGRFQCEMTDVDPSTLAIGDRVEMTFRRLYTADGVHNYFWKARPVRAGGGND